LDILKIDLKAPYWCSFTEYGSLNIKKTYPVIPPTTLYGMILNGLGVPSPHNVEDKKKKNKLKQKIIDNYNDLSFSICIKDEGIIVEDYLNISKGNRNIEDEERNLKNILKDFIKENYNDIGANDRNYVARKISKSIIKKKNLEKISDKLSTKVKEKLLSVRKDFFIRMNKKKKYNIYKKWNSTQVIKQRIIKPQYFVYIKKKNHNKSNLSLKDIEESLKRPKRPLYIGESDDFVNIKSRMITSDKIKENIKSDQISSLVPGAYPNCELCNIPVRLRYEKKDVDKSKILCSIPKQNTSFSEKLNCTKVDGEYIVFL